MHQHKFDPYRVKFKDGTYHTALMCDCGKHGGFAKKGVFNLDDLQERKTDRQRRIEEGLPIGCRVCGTEKEVQIIGFCGGCRHSLDAKAIRLYAKKKGLRVWDLDPLELCEAIQLPVIAI